MVYKKYCNDCEKKFQPVGRSGRLCKECRVARKEKVIQRTKRHTGKRLESKLKDLQMQDELKK